MDSEKKAQQIGLRDKWQKRRIKILIPKTVVAPVVLFMLLSVLLLSKESTKSNILLRVDEQE